MTDDTRGPAVTNPVAELEAGFIRRLLSVAFLVRLLALVLGVLAQVGRELTPQVAGVVLVLGASSYLGIARHGRLLDLFVRHPIIALVDVLLVLVVTYAVGPDSPLVFATLSTALIVGLLFPARIAVVLGVSLVAGYSGVWGSGDGSASDYGFFIVYGIPLLYVSLIGIGHAVRSVHRDQLDALTALSHSRSATAAANERVRLAREMHDSLAKSLHGVAIGAAALPHWVGADPDRAVRQAKLLADGAERAAEQTRTLLTRLRSDQPDQPLSVALAELCQDWSRAHGIVCGLSVNGAADVAGDARYELVSVVGESLENVARHAQATTVQVRVDAAGDEVAVSISDDGRGMPTDLERLRRDGHYGVVGMRERVHGIGGTFEIGSSPGRGTRVQVRIPGTTGTVAG